MKVNAKTGDVQMAWRDRRAIVLHRAAFICEECGDATATEVDHIWPKSWGGQDDLENLRATCLPCNRSKGGKAYIKDLDYQRACWASSHFADQAYQKLLLAAQFEVMQHLFLWVVDESPRGAYEFAREFTSVSAFAVWDLMEIEADRIQQQLKWICRACYLFTGLLTDVEAAA